MAKNPDDNEKLINLEHQVERLEDDPDKATKDASEAKQRAEELTAILRTLCESVSLLNDNKPVRFFGAGFHKNDPEVRRRNLLIDVQEMLAKLPKRSKQPRKR